MQLLTPSSILAKTSGRENISRGDVEETAVLFLDAKASARLLAEGGAKFLGN